MIVVLFLCLDLYPAIVPAIEFSHLNTSDGLSQQTVHSIMQDRQGFLWFGTSDGLNRYDGIKFKHYYYSPSDSNSLIDNYVLRTTELRNGEIWFGSYANGITRFQPKTGKFQRVTLFNPLLGRNMSRINSIFESANGDIWIGSEQAGIAVYHPDRNNFEYLATTGKAQQFISSDSVTSIQPINPHLLLIATRTQGLFAFDTKIGLIGSFNSANTTGLLDNTINKILIDSSNRIWLGTQYQGLVVAKWVNSQLRILPLLRQTGPVSRDNAINALFEDSEHNLWVGSENGLYRLDATLKNVKIYRHDERLASSLSGNDIYAIFQSRDGTIWVSSHTTGLSRTNNIKNQFKHLNRNKLDLIAENTWAIALTGTKYTWIGSDGGGLSRYSHALNRVKSFVSETNGGPLASDRIWSVLPNSDGSVWVGTYGKGLDLLYPNDGRAIHSSVSGLGPVQLKNDYILALYRDSKDTIWIGTYGGLHRFEPKTGRTKLYVNNDRSDSLSNNSVLSIFEDSKGRLWIGTYGGGLNLFDSVSESFTRYSHDKTNPKSLSNDIVLSIAEDKNHQIWIATASQLNLFDESQNIFYHYGTPHGLNNDTIYGLEVDNQNTLWLATTKGISSFLPVSRQFTNFTVDDGVQPGEFNSNAHTVDSLGRIYFGGIAGITYFDPVELEAGGSISSPLFTGLKIFNQAVNKTSSVQTMKGVTLDKTLSYAQSITLDYRQQLFSLAFSSIDFQYSQRIRFAYRLKGWDERWIYTEPGQNEATFSNIPAGNYLFEVKAGIFDKWNENPASMQIRITPPFWRTNLAYVLYATASLLMLAFYLMQQKRIIIANEKKRNAEIHSKEKANYLATMSHEIRTPLNGIIGAATMLEEQDNDPESNHFARMIKVSGENLLYIVNDILSLSKIEAGKEKLELHEFSLSELIEDSISVFTNNLEDKSNNLIWSFSDNVPEQVIADSTRLRQVLLNLINNALKFTENGLISVRIESNLPAPSRQNSSEQILKFSVSDTGIGIPQDKQAQIFSAFEQANEKTFRKFGGTGLGLSICKKLVEMFGDQLEVSSEEGKGTTFYFNIPLKSISQSPTVTNAIANQIVASNRVYLIDLPEEQAISTCYILTAGRITVSIKQFEELENQLFDASSLLIVNVTTTNINELEALFQKALRTIVIVTPNQQETIKQKYPEQKVDYLLKPLSYRLLAEKLSMCSKQVATPVSDSVRDRHAESFLIEKEQHQKQRDKSSISKSHGSNLALSGEVNPVLIAEDNAINLKVLQHFVAATGRTSDLASNGHEILDKLKRRNYQVLISDVQMPGMDGLEAAQRIRELGYRDLQIVLCTGEDPDSLTNLIETGVIQAILEKPVAKSDLKNLLEILEKKM